MRRKLVVLLSVVVFLFCGHYAVAGTAYDEYKAEIAKAEKNIEKYENENAELQAYLDAVDSGNQEAWEAARKKSAVLHALMMHKDSSELDAVKSQIKTNESMIQYYQNQVEYDQHKMDIYFHAYILQDLDAVNEILSNGNRTIPEDVSDNMYCAWPCTEIPEGLLTDKIVLGKNRGNVYLTPATVTEHLRDSIYYVDIGGVIAEAKIENCRVSVGETVNIYFTVFMMENENLAFIIVGESEKNIDGYHSLRIREE